MSQVRIPTCKSLNVKPSIKTCEGINDLITSCDLPEETPLHVAIKQNNLAQLKELVESGSDIEEIGEDGDAPFVVAIRTNNAAALKILIDMGCDLTNMDGLNSSALGLSTIYGHVDCIRVLIAEGEDIDEASYFAHNSLMLAAFQGHQDVVRVLLESRADPNAVNRHGMVPLHKALMVIQQEDEAARHNIVKMLLQYGANPCTTINNPDFYGSFLLLGRACPLSFAIATGYISLVRIILTAGHDIHLEDLDHWRKSSYDNNMSHAFYTSPQITNPVIDWITNPRTLLHIARNKIRQLLRPPIPKSVECLEGFIGRNLVLYVNFSDMDEIGCEEAENRADIISSFPGELNTLENNTLRLLKKITR